MADNAQDQGPKKNKKKTRRGRCSKKRKQIDEEDNHGQPPNKKPFQKDGAVDNPPPKNQQTDDDDDDNTEKLRKENTKLRELNDSLKKQLNKVRRDCRRLNRAMKKISAHTVCYLCSEKGHISKNCPHKHKKPDLGTHIPASAMPVDRQASLEKLAQAIIQVGSLEFISELTPVEEQKQSDPQQQGNRLRVKPKYKGSATYINQATELYLNTERGKERQHNTSAYDDLRLKFPDIPSVAEIRVTIESMIDSVDELREKKFELRSLSVLHADAEAQFKAQPLHADVANRVDLCSADQERFGILMLTQGSPGTTVVNMDAVSPKMTLDVLFQSVWKDAPVSLQQKLRQNQRVVQEIAKFGQLLFVEPSRHVRCATAEQFSLCVLKGNHPHGKPTHENGRAVIFFTLLPAACRGLSGYDGETQVSKSVLTLQIRDLMHIAAGDQMSERENSWMASRVMAAYCEDLVGGTVDENLQLDQQNPDPAGREKFIQIVKEASAWAGKTLAYIDEPLESDGEGNEHGDGDSAENDGEDGSSNGDQDSDFESQVR